MNPRHLHRMFAIAAACFTGAMPASALTLRCPRDSVMVGGVCTDTYEASVWQIPPSNALLLRLVQNSPI